MRSLKVLSALLVVVLLSANVLAVNLDINKDDPRYSNFEANLVKGLKSDNEGLQFSSAYMLGEIKSEFAQDLLIRMLRDHEDVNFRIMAALSLTKIGTEQALFMVKRVGKFTDNEKLASFCAKFHKAKTYELPKKDKELVTQLFE